MNSLRGVALKGFLLALAGAALLSSSASAQPTSALLMPGVSFQRTIDFTLHGPVAVNVIEGPKPAGLYSLRPVLPGGGVRGRDRLTAIERRLSPVATVAGVDGDLSSSAGRPAGFMLDAGVVNTQPLKARSSLGVDAAGNLFIDRLPFVGDWRGTGSLRALSGLNDVPGPNGTVLLTRAWGTTTPASSDAVEAVLSQLPPLKPNTPLTGTVVQLLRGGNHSVPAGGAVLMARGNAATRLAAEAPVGTKVTTRVILPSPFSTAVAGIGGGPVLVKNGKPVFRANEAFASSWLVSRMARTAVGQRADGRILLVAVDGGRPAYSAGMTNFELAQEMVRLGAVTAMGLDSGASTAMAFEGDLLNRPSGAERAIGEALTLQYVGVQAPPPTAEVLSPNGDAVDEKQALAYKVVRRSDVTAVVLGPGNTRVTLDAGNRNPGVYKFSWAGRDSTGKLLPEGRWTWHIGAVDDLHRTSTADRVFFLNTTLKGLTVQPSAWRRSSPLSIGFDLDRPATVTLTIETRSGTVLRTLAHRPAGTGHFTTTWNGRLRGRRKLPAGTYVVRVVAENQVGTAELTQPLRALH